MDKNKLLILTCWWTIDKNYAVWRWTYNFDISSSVIPKIFWNTISEDYNLSEICKKDSQDMTDDDKNSIKKMILSSKSNMILITHWTDTMITTWKFLESIKDKTIVITWSSLPEIFKNTDADFNVWFALWVLKTLNAQNKYWVYIAMNWNIFNVDNVTKNENWVFTKIS